MPWLIRAVALALAVSAFLAESRRCLTGGCEHLLY